ncbi:hypothetical protein GPECTOR_8g326 [Gonium pectorale]|uniref:dolichyl-phosphate beta-glucosyltransferase n=1 Tax=Gonium pectorale TaxID=33097 RepID=A0A150GTA6_GONPE|nr:hypothetical protein GPECTOR_8g326 [Gonium pectorale]|eukprot:KXZ52952.1 hypothetical protein GPECTOR_8g326 [Gonium pectorale]
MGKVLNIVTSLTKEFDEPIQCTLEDPDSATPVPCPLIIDAPTKALSCIIPAYNEEDRLGSTLDEALAYLQERRERQGPSFTYELIIVDDGSKDGTAKVAAGYIRRHGMDTVRLLRVSANRGKGHAVKRGMLAARGEYCLLMDADGATRFADLEKLEAGLEKIMVPTEAKLAEGILAGAKSLGRGKGGLGGGVEALEAGLHDFIVPSFPSAASARAGSTSTAASSSGAAPADPQGPLGVAYGSRAHLHKDAVTKRSPMRNFLTRGFHLLVFLVAGGRVRDTQCGFKLFTRRAAAVLFSNQRLQRWCFDVELLVLANKLGIPVCEVSVNWTEIPGSKIRFTSIILMAFELLIIKVAYQMMGSWPIHSEATLSKKAN